MAMRSGVREATDEQMDKDLAGQTQQSYDDRDKSGKFGKIWVAPLPAGFKEWKVKEGEHYLDLVPFLAGPYHPQRNEKQISYNLDLWAHRNIGAREDNWICPLRTQRLDGTPIGPCPICEFQKYLVAMDVPPERAEAHKTLIKSLNPSRRCIYNVWIHDDIREEGLGVQVWEIAHWFFEKTVIELARLPRGGGLLPFSHSKKGKTIRFTRKGMKNTEFLAHQFMDRQQNIPQLVLDQAWALDTLVKWPTYPELWKAFFDEDYVEGMAMPMTAPGVKMETREVEHAKVDTATDPVADAQRAREDFPAGEPAAATEVSGAAYVVPEKEQPPKEQTPSKIEDDIPFKEPQQEASTAAEPVTQPAAEPAAEATPETAPTTSGCPAGAKFGVDIDRKPELCDNCDQWDPCYNEKRRLRQLAKQQQKEPAKEQQEPRRGRASGV